MSRSKPQSPDPGPGAGLRVAGLAKLSTCDWPGMLAATVFCQGCPWHCRYCHNPELIPPGGPAPVPWQQVLSFLRRRRGLLDAVVFSGGEPTMQLGLIPALRAARDLGFATGLHTNGAYPRRLAAALADGLLDWVGFDIKAPPGRYQHITGSPVAARQALVSLRLLLAAEVGYEVRTTVDPELLDEPALTQMVELLHAAGVRVFCLQSARPAPGDQPSLAAPVQFSPTLIARCRQLFPTFTART